MREERIGDCRLILGDCLEVLPTLGAVDCVVTDPPYELSSTGPGAAHHFGTSLAKFDGAAYKAIVSGVDYTTLMAAIEVKCNPFNLFCFCSNKQISKLMAINEAAGRATTLLVWHKTNAVPFANGVWRGDIEYVVHARSQGAVFQGNAEEKKKVTEHPLVVDSSHPTVKPQSLIHKYIRIGSRLDQTLLDPFMGSGTTLVACAKLGRKGIGIEISEEYFEIACERVRKAYAQPDFFVERPAPATQEAMDL